jgi:uncharacterized protein (DUF779 family)
VPAVSVTTDAEKVIERLVQKHGPLAIFQSGGCCDGSAAICLLEGELPAGPHDVELGRVGGVPFYVDGDQHDRWGNPDFVLGVSSGAAEGFSLEGLEGVHFVSRSPA